MTHATASHALRQYGRVRTQGGIESANPHQLVTMLLSDALSRIATARGYMQRGEIAAKGECISRAIGILSGLRVSLDHDRGGELAQRLDSLYEYMSQRLLQANAGDDVGALDEVTGLLRPIKEAWDAIPAELHNAPHPPHTAMHP